MYIILKEIISSPIDFIILMLLIWWLYNSYECNISFNRSANLITETLTSIIIFFSYSLFKPLEYYITVNTRTVDRPIVSYQLKKNWTFKRNLQIIEKTLCIAK